MRVPRAAVPALVVAVMLSGCVSAPAPSSSPSATSDEWPEPADTTPVVVEDGGPRDGATGSVVDAAPGTEYTVASGDVAVGIAERFDVELDQLIDDAGVRLGSYPSLFPGDLIRFTSALTGIERECFYGLPVAISDLERCRQTYHY